MTSAPNAFHGFLINLSKDTRARSAYQTDPMGVMKAAGLSDPQIIAVLSQDPNEIQKELGGGNAAIRVRVTIIVSVEI